MNQTDLASTEGRLTVGGVPEGFDALVVADLARTNGKPVLHIARDDARAAAFSEAVRFFAPDYEVIFFPAWDCLPYDRVSPKAEIASERLAALSALERHRAEGGDKPLIVVTTVNAAIQRVPTPGFVTGATFHAHVGNRIALDQLTAYLETNAYHRASVVAEHGDYAVRGGIVDVFPPGATAPLRFDFFGDTLDALRTFDVESQTTTGQIEEIDLVPVSEVLLDEETINRFRRGYRAQFGSVTDEDQLYESVSAGRKHIGMEHWLPLFHEELVTIFDYLPEATVSLDTLDEEAVESRYDIIHDYYDSRKGAMDQPKNKLALSTVVYKPLPPELLYLTKDEWAGRLGAQNARGFTPFQRPEGAEGEQILNLTGKRGRNFAAERAQEGVNVFDAVADHIAKLRAAKKRVLLASWSIGARERLKGVLTDHGVNKTVLVKDWPAVQATRGDEIGLAVLGLEHGFETDDLAIISEQDILGDRLIRSRKKTKRGADFIQDAGTLELGDLVVHVDHGIGRYDGLKTLEVSGAPHDCLLILYHNNDKLYLPVENIELLSRYGSEDENIQLDRLGGGAWQARKAKLKERIRDMAEQLIKVAAARELRHSQSIEAPDGVYAEFCARFPFEETEDQENAIEDVLTDMGQKRPMDRLVCGDVGFGKTEVALRSAFVAAMSGHQVAVVVPTTLLCRQHFKTFTDRFADWPLKIRQLSRLVTAKDIAETKEGMANGDIDIVIGTHALLAKTIKFKDLGLLIVDEEQHFGVAHKEKLKQLRADVHVLTLTATPIPRTLQLALSGVREMSLIATPPVDRLAVRTFVSPFDPMIVREALLREHYRGGQSFYVVPRIKDLKDAAEFLAESVPEVKFVTAHGQMPPSELDEVMNAFYEGKFDVLVSTTIVESGLDIPTANTLVIHRADMFGLSQLYQLRGRVGRAKSRAYAYFTVPPNKKLTANAERRLEVLQSLDHLGAGFSLASHDLDIRGAGNLLGDEQSGHIKEVGLELYQEMLEEAVAALRDGADDAAQDGQWSPQINIGTAVLIPDHYVPDLNVRLSLYRRLSEVEDAQDIDAFAAELIDRFGALPEEVEHLLKIVTIKKLCRDANVEKVEAGPKGVVVGFRNNDFANPAGLLDFISTHQKTVKLRPDQTVFYSRNWPDAEDRLAGTQKLLKDLVELAEQAKKAA